MENKLCSDCIEKYFYKSISTSKNCKTCKEIPRCSLCVNFEDEATTFKIYNLKRKYTLQEDYLRAHNEEVQNILSDIGSYQRTLDEVRNQIDEENININEIKKKLQDLNLELKNFTQICCITTPELSDYEPNNNFLPQKTVYESTSTIWNEFCSSCKKKFAEICDIYLLSCGHSLCLKCLPEPICLNCEGNTESVTEMKGNLIQFVKYLHKKFTMMESELDSHVNELKNLILKVENSISGLLILWDDFLDNEISVECAKSKICAYEVDLKGIEISSCKPNKTGEMFSTLFLSGEDPLESKNALLHQVYYLLKNGVKIYGISSFNEPKKFGKFSFEKSVILFHVVHLQSVEDSANFVIISDLKLALNESNFFPFMIIRCNEDNFEFRFMMRLYDTQLSIQFIKLCIGEFEASYKNSSYVKGDESNSFYESILHVPMYVKHERETLGALELFSPYDKNSSELDEYKTGDLFLIGKLDGSFSICRSLSDGTKVKSFGVVQKLNEFNDINYKDSKHLRIIDCGLQIMHL